MMTIEYSKSPQFILLVINILSANRLVRVLGVTRATLYKRLYRAGHFYRVSTDPAGGAIIRSNDNAGA